MQRLPEITNKLIESAGANLMDYEEDDITGDINNILNDKLRESSGYLFRFEAKSGPDILIFASPYQSFSDPLLVIEAKRLPPTSKRDYVRTGIGRFKTEEHGKHHDIAAMLGPITYDIASLLQDAYIIWPEKLIEDIVFKHYDYLINQNNKFNNLSKDQFLKYFYLTGLQRHIKNLGIFARLK